MIDLFKYLYLSGNSGCCVDAISDAAWFIWSLSVCVRWGDACTVRRSAYIPACGFAVIGTFEVTLYAHRSAGEGRASMNMPYLLTANNRLAPRESTRRAEWGEKRSTKTTGSRSPLFPCVAPTFHYHLTSRRPFEPRANTTSLAPPASIRGVLQA